jgi:Bacterial pre-peptidase C-terminal domain
VHKFLSSVSNHSRSPISGLLQKSAGLAVVLLLSAGLGSAVASSPEASLRLHKSAIRAARGIQPSQSIACTTQATGCNTTVTGSLTTDDCKLSFDQSFYDAWTVQVTAGQTVQITQTAGFDAYLILFDTAGNEIDENDDGPGLGTNARITFTADVTGTYTIYANSREAGETGSYSLEVTCNTVGPQTCVANSTTLCLNNGRFKVTAIFSAPSLNITNAPAQAVPLTSDTGYFWFFSASNVELVLKAVDGRAFNGFFWVFYGALSDVEYHITVTDTTTGGVKTYNNTAGHLASVADTAAFPGTGAAASSAPAASEGSASLPSIDAAVRQESAAITHLLSAATAEACTANDTTLCLNGGRFQVRTIFSAPSLGITNAPAHAVPLTSDTGYFWFFSASNVELVLKAVDGRTFNNHFWVFYGALSDVEYTITVTDMVTGAVKTYSNTAGHLASVADTAAFVP